MLYEMCGGQCVGAYGCQGVIFRVGVLLFSSGFFVFFVLFCCFYCFGLVWFGGFCFICGVVFV